MTPERWQQVNELFKSTLARAPEERSDFLHQVCSDDEALRCEVESLIDSYEQENSFMETPAVATVAHSLVGTHAELVNGEVIGRYEIVTRIEGGGQGEVYLARDTRLGRQVALKLLPGYMGEDEERLRRFEQEARAASALNHPNVCVIHEVGETEDRHFIVMEYVEGVTLRRHMTGRLMDFTEVLDVARQIASGLAAAHAVGVVHRDIKPENIMLRTDGYVKVLDFGLAKLTERQAVKVATTPAMAGMSTNTAIMGTVGYMSPEQAQGESVDERTDIFSLGVVIYEMVAGRLPFEIKTPNDLIGRLPEEEPPPLAKYLPEVPASLELIVSKALRKARVERYQTVAELLTALNTVKWGRAAKHGPISRGLILLAAALSIMIGGSLWFYASRHTANSSFPAMKYVSFTSFPGWEGDPAFSPDGNRIAFVWTGEMQDNNDIYVMSIGSTNPMRLTTDPAADYSPSWSPDGKQIAFVRVTESETAIYTVPALGGPEHKLLSGCGGDLDWSPDGKYIACVESRSRQEPPNILLFSPETGARNPLTSPAAPDLGDGSPVFSPDGRTVAFIRTASLSASAFSSDIYLISVTGGEPKRLTFDNVPLSSLAWTADGREVVFSSTRAGGDFSLWRMEASGGTPERLAVGGHYVPSVSISRQRNRLAYVQWSGDFNIYRIEIPGSTAPGKLPVKLTSSTRLDYAPQYSPNGKRIVFQSDRSGSQEIWTCDSDGSNLVQVTTLGKWVGAPRWSPDGQQITFDLHTERKSDIYVVGAEGGPPRPIVTDDSDDNVPSWSSDGRWIYFASNRTGEREVWKVRAEGGEAVQVTHQGGGVALESPDGKYVYYTKDLAPGIWRVPVDGGEEARVFDSFNSEYSRNWAVVSDGIYFINPDAKDGAAIDFFDFATAKTKRVAGLGKVVIDFFAQGISVSPDHRQILYAQNDNAGGDIMLVENFR